MGKIGVLSMPTVGMVMAECAQVGLMIFSKAAMSNGMSNLIFVFYSNAFAFLVLLPTSFFFHRSQRPPLTLSVFSGCLLLGFLGLSAQLFGYAGINYSSPTLCTAMLNLIPAFTYIFAISLRIEKLNWRSSIGLAKSVGTIVSILGAFIVTFYKGPSLLRTSSSSSSSLAYTSLLLQQSNWVLAGFLFIADCVFASSWLLVQASILKIYRAELFVVFYYSFFVSVLSGVLSLIVERDLHAWSLVPEVRWTAVLYSAVLGNALQCGVSAWCMQRAGPVFVSMFKPLGIVIAFAAGVIFSGDTIYLGRLIGAIIIVTGFYGVMWAKAKEAKIDGDTGVGSLEPNTQQAPLLQNSIEET